MKFLKELEPQPEPRMKCNGRALTVQETHAAWCQQLANQSRWPKPWDIHYDVEVRTRVEQLTERVRRFIGLGEFDTPILQPEVQRQVQDWDTSKALPPDRLPRAVFQAGSWAWDRAVWKVLSRHWEKTKLRKRRRAFPKS